MDVKMPDGTIIKNVPDHYSQEDLLAQYSQMQKPSDVGTTTESGAATGVYPQMTGRHAVQDTERAKNIPLALIESAVAGGMSIPSAVAQFLGTDKPAQLFQAIKQNAADISYPAVANIGSTAGEFGTTILPAAKAYQLASKLPGMLGTSELVKGGLSAATAAGLTPVKPTENYGEFAGEKAKQVGLGAAIGAPLSKASQMIFNPKVSDDVQKLLELGMTKLTPGQILGQIPVIGPALREGEKKLTSVPLMGDIIGGGLRTSFKDFNKAMANKALEPMGITVPKGMKEGEETNQFINQSIRDAYEDVLNNSTFRNNVIDTHGRDVAQRLRDAMDYHSPNLSSDSKEFKKNVQSDIIDTIQKGKLLGGDVYREMEQKLGELTTGGYLKNPTLGKAYENMLQELRNELALQNPRVARHLQNAHEVFKNMDVLSKAAGMRAADQGVYTPAQFKSAVESTAGRKNVAQGMGRFIDESQAASNVLGGTVPDSGTAGRSLMAQLALGGFGVGLHAPLLAKSALASAAYSPLGMKALTTLATKRPDIFIRNQPAMSKGLSALGSIGSAQQPAEEQE